VTLRVVPATPDRWDDVDAVMGPSGGDARCWCQWFHQDARTWEARGRGNRDLLRAQVVQGPPPGLVALDDDVPVGWVALAPRSTYERIPRSPVMRPDPARDGPLDDPGTWTITCFVVPRGHRGRGLMAVLLDGAVDHARRAGAHAVEAHPVDTAGAPAPSANLYYGVLSTFLGAGFTLVDRPRPGRARVRLDL
jgi:GNAT superfamily N-acetyltransferase